MTDANNRASGCLFGVALGDALGAKTEFLSVREIHQRFGLAGGRVILSPLIRLAQCGGRGGLDGRLRILLPGALG